MKFFLFIQILLLSVLQSLGQRCQCSPKHRFAIDKDSSAVSINGEYSIVDSSYPIVLIFEGEIDNIIEVKKDGKIISSHHVKTLPRLEVDSNTVFVDSIPNKWKCHKIGITVFQKDTKKEFCFIVTASLPVVYFKQFSNDIWSITTTNYMKSYDY